MKVHMQFCMILLCDLMASFPAKSRHAFGITLLQDDGVTINLDPSVTMWSRVFADPILDIKYKQEINFCHIKSVRFGGPFVTRIMELVLTNMSAKPVVSTSLKLLTVILLDIRAEYG